MNIEILLWVLIFIDLIGNCLKILNNFDGVFIGYMDDFKVILEELKSGFLVNGND